MFAFRIRYAFLALLLALVVLVPRAGRAQMAEVDPQLIHAQWNSLLYKYVSPTGRVNYRGFIADRAKLESYLQLICKTNPDAQANWTSDDRKAFWLNVYNAATVQTITQYYPVASMKDIRIKAFLGSPKSPWEKSMVNVGGQRYSLNEIEKEVLSKRFKDPQVHFALVCASVSCPNLLGEAYDGAKLQKQLDGQTKRFINDATKNDITAGKVALSNIFDWYAADFGGSDPNIANYLNRYSKVRIAPGTKLEYLPYNWDLNDRPETPLAPPMAAGRK
jgi:hypothetical protein